ncbi:MAG: RNA polymerase sigma factor RpoD/SigA [Spirochaetota bacterium]|nr:RNA polymerase sigma factor RpoD/SigA [Spirochaetota bacterium]
MAKESEKQFDKRKGKEDPKVDEEIIKDQIKECESDEEVKDKEMISKTTKKRSKKKKIDDYKDSSISWYLEQINKIPLLPRDQEERLARESIDGNEKSKECLIKANLRFVVTIAKKYQTSGISLLDLINEGNMGLIRAADKFDPDKGFHFISYAIWWIRQAILLAISQKTSLIRLPLNRTADIQRIEKVRRKLENHLGREPNPSEIAEGLNLDDEEVNRLRSITQDFISLDSTYGDSEDTTYVGMIEDSRIESPDKKVFDESLKEALESVLNTLSSSEKEILKMRFGLDGYTPMSLQEIGDKFHLTKERIRQIEKKAIRQLRHPSRSQKLKSFLRE